MLTTVPYQYKKLSLSLLYWRTYGTQHIVLVTMIYYSNVVRILSQSEKETTKAKYGAIHFQASYVFSIVWTVADNTRLKQQQNAATCMSCFYLGKLISAQCPRFILGAAPVGTLCLECTKVPESQKENSFLT